MKKAWIFRDHRQKQKLGDAAPWLVGWTDADGRRRSKTHGAGERGMAQALRHVQRIDAGIDDVPMRKSWAEFRREYEEQVVARLAANTRAQIKAALDHFERLCRPRRVSSIRTMTIDTFTARRRAEAGKNRGDRASPATINKNLRTLKAVLGKARQWRYLPEVPHFTMEREPQRIPVYVTPEHFAAMYGACQHAKLPVGLPAEWWRTLLTTAYMTGWRINQLLTLRTEDVDLTAGVAVARAENTKGRRDERVNLHPVVTEHLPGIMVGEGSLVFEWPHDRTTLQKQFGRIQRKAGIRLPCRHEHVHTPACHVYGFHDLRRAFATVNADRLSLLGLKRLMQHKSLATTQGYVDAAFAMQSEVAKLYVPDVLRRSETGVTDKDKSTLIDVSPYGVSRPGRTRTCNQGIMRTPTAVQKPRRDRQKPAAPHVTRKRPTTSKARKRKRANE